MGELLQKAELLSQSPSINSVNGFLCEIARRIETLELPKAILTTGILTTSVDKNSAEKNIKKKKNV